MKQTDELNAQRKKNLKNTYDILKKSLNTYVFNPTVRCQIIQI